MSAPEPVCPGCALRLGDFTFTMIVMHLVLDHGWPASKARACADTVLKKTAIPLDANHVRA